jgi:hypothetical protein
MTTHNSLSVGALTAGPPPAEARWGAEALYHIAQGEGGRNSHLCRAGIQPRSEQAPEYFTTACAAPPAQSPPFGVDVRTCLPGLLVTHHSPLVTNFLIATADPRSIAILSDHWESKQLSSILTEKHAYIQQAKKRLIATLPNSKFAATYSKRNYITISNRNNNRASTIAPFRGPPSTTHSSCPTEFLIGTKVK